MASWGKGGGRRGVAGHSWSHSWGLCLNAWQQLSKVVFLQEKRCSVRIMLIGMLNCLQTHAETHICRRPVTCLCLLALMESLVPFISHLWSLALTTESKIHITTYILNSSNKFTKTEMSKCHEPLCSCKIGLSRSVLSLSGG